MFTKKTITTETYVLPEEFDHYFKIGYVIFTSKPTVFGTFRAVRIEAINKNGVLAPNKSLAKLYGRLTYFKPLNKLMHTLMLQPN